MSDCLRLWKLRTNWLNKIYIVLFAYFRVYCMFKPLFKTAKTVDQPLQILISRVPIHIPYMHANSLSERELSRSNQTCCTARLTATAKFTYPSRMTSTAEYRSRSTLETSVRQYYQFRDFRIPSRLSSGISRKGPTGIELHVFFAHSSLQPSEAPQLPNLWLDSMTKCDVPASYVRDSEDGLRVPTVVLNGDQGRPLRGHNG